MIGWHPMETAPKDGTPVLVRFKDHIPSARDDVRKWEGIAFVGRSRGDIMEWGFAAPVGMGGFPDDWLDGWCHIPHPMSVALSDGE